ncbi:hypothetical protein [Rhodophyticola sp.]|uniref:hypothetical protein n=1 Tax=Rhodophyticola sp. TaxID=2680032 RepID=UPI003D2920CC
MNQQDQRQIQGDQEIHDPERETVGDHKRQDVEHDKADKQRVKCPRLGRDLEPQPDRQNQDQKSDGKQQVRRRRLDRDDKGGRKS